MLDVQYGTVTRLLSETGEKLEKKKHVEKSATKGKQK